MLRCDIKTRLLRKLMCKSYETDIHNRQTFGTFVHAKIRKTKLILTYRLYNVHYLEFIVYNLNPDTIKNTTQTSARC